MQKILSSLLLASSALFAALPSAGSDEELLHARRIFEFWKDQDNQFIRSEIETFFQNHPKSEFADYFYAILGDLAIEEGHFANALHSYSLIGSPDIEKKVRIKRWNALYQLKHYQQLYQEIAPQKAYIEEPEGQFYLAEAALREGLEILKKGDDASELSQALLKEAQTIYGSLLDDDVFGEHAQLAMAEIFKQTGETEKAASFYLEIAQKQKSPTTLFHAGMLLLQCGHEERACEIFGRLAKRGSVKASEASYHWMQLLAKRKDWEVLQQERRLFLTTLDTTHLPIFHFYLGMVAFNEERFGDAITPLNECIKTGIKPPHYKAALLALLSASKEVGECALCEACYQEIQEFYPEELERAALMRALCYKHADNYSKALPLLSHLCEKLTDKALLEKAHLEKIHLLFETKEWEETHQAINLFLTTFPNSSHQNDMMRLAVDLSLASLNSEKGYQALAIDLSRALQQEGLYPPEQALSNQLLLIKCYYKLGETQACLDLANDLLEEHPNHPDLHYLLTLGYAKQGGNFERVVKHGETALKLSPNYLEKDKLQLHLFNAYLQKSKSDQNSEWKNKAADHLYCTLDILPISLENRLWLANHYAKSPSNWSRTIEVLEKTFDQKAELVLQYPKEALLLANLYQQKQRHESALKLLETLRDTDRSDLVTLSMAISQFELGQHHLAKEVFEHLSKMPDQSVSTKAKLFQSRLMLGLAEERESGLSQLKELWLQKKLQTEPIHLEAALDYVDSCALREPPLRILALLHEIKDHFTTVSDIHSKDYHESRALDPKQDALYQAYMRLIDAKIYSVEAHLPTLKAEEAEMKKKAARAYFTTLLQGKHAATAYIVNQAEKEVNGSGNQ